MRLAAALLALALAVDTASAKLAVLERNGYSPLGYFVLPEPCWTDNYYAPLRAGFSAFLTRHGHSEEARAVVAENEQELAAVALMAEDDDPATPRSLTLMAGPIDTRVAPTKVNELAMSKPIEWIEAMLSERFTKIF